MSPEDRKSLGKAGRTFNECQESASAKSEKELQEQIASYLRQHDIFYNVNRMDRPTSCIVGWPDLTFAVDGQAVAWEVKMPGKKRTPEQLEAMAKLIRDGWEYRLITSVAEAAAHLKEMNK